MTPAKLAEIEGLMEKADGSDCAVFCDSTSMCSHVGLATSTIFDALPDLIAAARFGMEAKKDMDEALRLLSDSLSVPHGCGCCGVYEKVEAHGRAVQAFLDAHPEDR